MEFSSPASSNYHCCKHFEAIRHPSGRPMHEKTSLFYCCSRLLLIVAFGQAALPAAAQTSINAFPSSAGSASQNGASPIPSQSPFLGGTPNGKASVEPISLTLRDAIDRGLRYNLGL